MKESQGVQEPHLCEKESEGEESELQIKERRGPRGQERSGRKSLLEKIRKKHERVRGC